MINNRLIKCLHRLWSLNTGLQVYLYACHSIPYLSVFHTQLSSSYFLFKIRLIIVSINNLYQILKELFNFWTQLLFKLLDVSGFSLN